MVGPDGDFSNYLFYGGILGVYQPGVVVVVFFGFDNLRGQDSTVNFSIPDLSSDRSCCCVRLLNGSGVA